MCSNKVKKLATIGNCYKFKNIQADTEMRENIAKKWSASDMKKAAGVIPAAFIFLGLIYFQYSSRAWASSNVIWVTAPCF